MQNPPTISNREYWEVAFPLSEVIAAAKVKVHFHESRVSFWYAEEDKARTVADSFHSELESSLAGAKTSNSYHGNQKYDAHVEDCKAKVREHKEKVERYKAFHRLLSRSGESMILLTINDMEFFGV
jgi:hypothetical protein